MYACVCRALTESDVRAAGRAGAVTPESLIAALGLDDGVCCGRCAMHIEPFIKLAWEGAALSRGAVASDAEIGARHGPMSSAARYRLVA